MKRKELHEYIRTEIINELTLSEDGTALVTTKGGTKPIAFKNPSELLGQNLREFLRQRPIKTRLIWRPPT